MDTTRLTPEEWQTMSVVMPNGKVMTSSEIATQLYQLGRHDEADLWSGRPMFGVQDSEFPRPEGGFSLAGIRYDELRETCWKANGG